MQRELRKSNKNKIISGVCGGIAEHLNVDPLLIRILWVIFGITVIGAIVYVVCALTLKEAE
jgi:phage shock protein C